MTENFLRYDGSSQVPLPGGTEVEVSGAAAVLGGGCVVVVVVVVVAAVVVSEELEAAAPRTQ